MIMPDRVALKQFMTCDQLAYVEKQSTGQWNTLGYRSTQHY